MCRTEGPRPLGAQKSANAVGLISLSFGGEGHPPKRRLTEPLEVLRLLVSRRVTYDSNSHRKICYRSQKTILPRTEVFVEVQTDGEDMVGELVRSLHGTRDAPVNWQQYLTELKEELGFITGRHDACVFCNPHRNISSIGAWRRVDGQLATKKISNGRTRSCTNSTTSPLEMVGPGTEDKKRVKVLNRVFTFDDSGVMHDVDPRHPPCTANTHTEHDQRTKPHLHWLQEKTAQRTSHVHEGRKTKKNHDVRTQHVDQTLRCQSMTWVEHNTLMKSGRGDDVSLGTRCQRRVF